MKTKVAPELVLAKMAALRTLNSGGFAHSGSGFLRAARFSGIRYGPEQQATCHPAAATLNALAWALEKDAEFVPMCADGKALDKKFYCHWMGIGRNDGPFGAVVARGLGEEVKLEDVRRGDLLTIWWRDSAPATPPAHVAYVFDAAFDSQGKTQAVQLFSAHGTGDTGPGISVFMDTAPMGEQIRGAKGSYALARDDLYDDRAFFETRGTWFSWREPSKVELVASAFRVESGRRIEPMAIVANINPARTRAVRFFSDQSPTPIEASTSELSYHHTTSSALADKGDAVAARGDPQARTELLLELGIPETRPQRHPDAKGKPVDEVPPSQKADLVPLLWHRQVQRQLAKLVGFGVIKTHPGEADGCMDDKTRAALKEFQTKKKLEAHGLPDPATRECLAKVLEKHVLAENEKADAGASGAQKRFASGRWEVGQALDTAIGLRILATTVGLPDGTKVFAEVLADGGDDVLTTEEGAVTAGKARFSVNAPRLAEFGTRFRLRLQAPDVEPFEPEHVLELLPTPERGGWADGRRIVRVALELFNQAPTRFLEETPVPWGDTAGADGPAPKAMAFVLECYKRVLGEARIDGVLGMKTAIRGQEVLVPFPASHLYYKDLLDIEVNARFTGDRRRIKAAFRRMKTRWKTIAQKMLHRKIEDFTPAHVVPGGILLWPVKSPQQVGHAALVVGAPSKGPGLRVVGATPKQGLVVHSLAPDELIGMVLLTWRR